MIRYKTRNRIIFHFTGRKVKFVTQEVCFKFGEEICAQKAVFVLELTCTFFIASYSKFMIQTLPLHVDLSFQKCFFCFVSIEINVKKTSVQLISTFMTASP